MISCWDLCTSGRFVWSWEIEGCILAVHNVVNVQHTVIKAFTIEVH